MGGRRSRRRGGGLRVWIRRPRRDAHSWRRVYRRGVRGSRRPGRGRRSDLLAEVRLPSPVAEGGGERRCRRLCLRDGGSRLRRSPRIQRWFWANRVDGGCFGRGLTLPRGAAVACLVDGDATRALVATSSSVACDVPPGPSGFVVVSVSDAVGSDQTFDRSQPPRTYAASPSAVDAGGGGVLSLAGVDMHRAVGFTFGGEADGAIVSSALGVVVSSALAVVEAPGAGKVVHRPADAVVAVAVGATRGGPIGYDAAGPAPPSSASVWLTPPRAIERVSPASGPAGGGQAVSFSLFPKLAGGVGSDGEPGGGAASAECWFGTFGPVRGRDDGAGGIECVTVAHVPGAVETHAAARPDARAGGYARRSPAIGGLHSEISENFEKAEIPNGNSYSFFASRFDRDGLSATCLLYTSPSPRD